MFKGSKNAFTTIDSVCVFAGLATTKRKKERKDKQSE